jgi:hypothetical protein
LIIEVGPPSRAQPYFAFGGGGAGGCGESEQGPGCGGIVYAYSRFGVGFEVGPLPSNLVTLDIGGWLGGIDNNSGSLRRFVVPMAGVGYYW